MPNPFCLLLPHSSISLISCLSSFASIHFQILHYRIIYIFFRSFSLSYPLFTVSTFPYFITTVIFFCCYYSMYLFYFISSWWLIVFFWNFLISCKFLIVLLFSNKNSCIKNEVYHRRALQCYYETNTLIYLATLSKKTYSP